MITQVHSVENAIFYQERFHTITTSYYRGAMGRFLYIAKRRKILNCELVWLNLKGHVIHLTEAILKKKRI